MESFPINLAATWQLLFYLTTLIIVIHAVVFSYHWISFGADKRLSTIGIIVYIAGAASLLLTMVLGLLFI